MIWGCLPPPRAGPARLFLQACTVRLDGRACRIEEDAVVMTSKPASPYDNAVRAVSQDVRVVALLAVVAFLLAIVPT